MKNPPEPKRKFSEIISQCPKCLTLMTIEPDGRKKSNFCSVIFPTAPKEECFGCQEEKKKAVKIKTPKKRAKKK